VSSDIVATAAIPERLTEMDWVGGECITDSQLMVDYHRTTRDGRIVFGNGAGGSRSADGFLGASIAARGGCAGLPRSFTTPFRDRQCGDRAGLVRPDRSQQDGLPLLGDLAGRKHILYGVGWSGNGVGLSRLVPAGLEDR
jgi:glycine/D-amino acid oxidase-like deaminating enzyme